MSGKHISARNLAAAFLAGPWSADELLRRGALACGRRHRWLRTLVRRVSTAFTSAQSQPSHDTLTCFIEADGGYCRAWDRHRRAGDNLLRQLFWLTPAMTATSGAPASWTVPALPTTTALASWLCLSPGELTWFADCHGREADVPAGPLRHYTYCWLPKASGQWRLLEVPKARLKALQRQVLHGILDRIPPHDAAHGYRMGRSILTFVAPHCGQRVVLRFDLRQFFASVRASRVHGLFAAAGYPPDVARLLTGVATNSVPADVWRTMPGERAAPPGREDVQRYRSPHLPQGAPTSPALANLCAYRLDCRLHGLAQSVGARYTRFADDLAFSGGAELDGCRRRFQVHVCYVALDEGFEVHTRKSRFMRRGLRQQLVGVVVNAHPNLGRDDYDRLKATLHNCGRHGPASQNQQGHSDFHAHLLGRIAHAALLNPARGAKLRALFERISWDE